MDRVRHSPGPAANQAFTFGIAAVIVLTVTLLGLLVWAGVVTITTVVLGALLGLPVLVIFVSCALSVWLGYDNIDIASNE